jgi:hypothetical protein
VAEFDVVAVACVVKLADEFLSFFVDVYESAEGCGRPYKCVTTAGHGDHRTVEQTNETTHIVHTSHATHSKPPPTPAGRIETLRSQLSDRMREVIDLKKKIQTMNADYAKIGQELAATREERNELEEKLRALQSLAKFESVAPSKACLSLLYIIV